MSDTGSWRPRQPDTSSFWQTPLFSKLLSKTSSDPATYQLPTPDFLAKLRLAELATPAAQMAWAVIHERPFSARWEGAPAHWPCALCSKPPPSLRKEDKG